MAFNVCGLFEKIAHHVNVPRPLFFIHNNLSLNIDYSSKVELEHQQRQFI